MEWKPLLLSSGEAGCPQLPRKVINKTDITHKCEKPSKHNAGKSFSQTDGRTRNQFRKATDMKNVVPIVPRCVTHEDQLVPVIIAQSLAHRIHT